MRINKFVSLALGIARRKADQLLLDGLIIVDNKPANMGQSVGEDDVVTLVQDGKQQQLKIIKTAPKILLMYKPTRIVTSNTPEGGNKTIFELLPAKYKDFKFAGRLDVMSEGLLVLSNDGGVVNTLTHPRFGHEKTYLVVTERLLRPNELAQLQKGVVIDGYLTRPARVQPLNQSPSTYKRFSFIGIHVHQPAYIVSLSEGRNQQIRKMMFSVNTRVKRLVRIQFGDYVLDPAMLKGKIVEIPWKQKNASQLRAQTGAKQKSDNKRRNVKG